MSTTKNMRVEFELPVRAWLTVQVPGQSAIDAEPEHVRAWLLAASPAARGQALGSVMVLHCPDDGVRLAEPKRELEKENAELRMLIDEATKKLNVGGGANLVSRCEAAAKTIVEYRQLIHDAAEALSIDGLAGVGLLARCKEVGQLVHDLRNSVRSRDAWNTNAAEALSNVEGIGLHEKCRNAGKFIREQCAIFDNAMAALPNVEGATLLAKCEAASRRISDQARTITRLEYQDREIANRLRLMVEHLAGFEGDTVFDKCAAAGKTLAEERRKRSELHRRAQQAESEAAMAHRALARHVAREDGLEAELGPDWVRLLKIQRDVAQSNCEAALQDRDKAIAEYNEAQRELADLRARLSAEISKRERVVNKLCEVVTVAHCGGSKNGFQTAHFLGLTGCLGTYGEAREEATHVQAEIRKIADEASA